MLLFAVYYSLELIAGVGGPFGRARWSCGGESGVDGEKGGEGTAAMCGWMLRVCSRSTLHWAILCFMDGVCEYMARCPTVKVDCKRRLFWRCSCLEAERDQTRFCCGRPSLGFVCTISAIVVHSGRTQPSSHIHTVEVAYCHLTNLSPLSTLRIIYSLIHSLTRSYPRCTKCAPPPRKTLISLSSSSPTLASPYTIPGNTSRLAIPGSLSAASSTFCVVSSIILRFPCSRLAGICRWRGCFFSACCCGFGGWAPHGAPQWLRFWHRLHRRGQGPRCCLVHWRQWGQS